MSDPSTRATDCFLGIALNKVGALFSSDVNVVVLRLERRWVGKTRAVGSIEKRARSWCSVSRISVVSSWSPRIAFVKIFGDGNLGTGEFDICNGQIETNDSSPIVLAEPDICSRRFRRSVILRLWGSSY